MGVVEGAGFVGIRQTGLPAVGSPHPTEVVVERAVLHAQHDDVLDTTVGRMRKLRAPGVLRRRGLRDRPAAAERNSSSEGTGTGKELSSGDPHDDSQASVAE